MTTTAKRYGRSIVALIAVAAALSCKPAQSTGPEPFPLLKASISGVDFSTSSAEVFGQYTSGVLAVAARSSDDRTIQFSVATELHLGPISVGNGTPNSAFTTYRTSHWRSNLPGGSGNVTITRVLGNVVEGTFSYTAVAMPETNTSGTRVVTGKFKIEY